VFKHLWGSVKRLKQLITKIEGEEPNEKEDKVDGTQSSKEQIEAIDELREEGRKLEEVFAAPVGALPGDQPRRWIERVQLYLRSTVPHHVPRFDEIVKDPRRYTGAV
jgi:hypothetical protein